MPQPEKLTFDSNLSRSGKATGVAEGQTAAIGKSRAGLRRTNYFGAFLDGFAGVGLFGGIRRLGAPKNFFDTRDISQVPVLEELLNFRERNLPFVGTFESSVIRDSPRRGFGSSSFDKVAAVFGELPARALDSLAINTKKYGVGKRIFDLVLAVLISPIVLPMMVLIGSSIALTAGWPVFFRQRRIGKHGREFFIWKFRTMRKNGDRILVDLLRRDTSAREEWSGTHRLRNDPRITRLGRFLRRTCLDELPQLFNILAGDMSFVGPRPIVSAETMKYADRFSYYREAMPGITGLWQISNRTRTSYKTRVTLDETYVSKWTFALDLWILVRTLPAVVRDMRVRSEDAI
jgi:lipopolysaccharide/colanic/teichoic acid biosynthesis glycosyltransferase